jgi:hypothetical protein
MAPPIAPIQLALSLGATYSSIDSTVPVPLYVA